MTKEQKKKMQTSARVQKCKKRRKEKKRCCNFLLDDNFALALNTNPSVKANLETALNYYWQQPLPPPPPPKRYMPGRLYLTVSRERLAEKFMRALREAA